MIVNNYGIHWENETTSWLEQGRGGTNVIGLREKSPFQVKLPGGRRQCNHNIPLATPIPNDRHWTIFMQLQHDPLVRAMMPFPKNNAGLNYIAESPRIIDFMVMLSRMTSPVLGVVVPFWSFENARDIVATLHDSNVQPLVLTGVTLNDLPTIREFAPAAANRPRKIIMSGAADVVLPPTVERIETELTGPKFDFNELNALPWEALGATAVKKWMRSEWAQDMHNKPQPR